MAGGDPVLGPGGRHPDHLLRSQVRREEREARDPRGNRASGEEEVLARLRLAPQRHADAEHEQEVEDQDDVVDPTELDALWHASPPRSDRPQKSGAGLSPFAATAASVSILWMPPATATCAARTGTASRFSWAPDRAQNWR